MNAFATKLIALDAALTNHTIKEATHTFYSTHTEQNVPSLGIGGTS